MKRQSVYAFSILILALFRTIYCSLRSLKFQMPESVNGVASCDLIENDMKNHIRFTSNVNLALVLALGEFVLSL